MHLVYFDRETVSQFKIKWFQRAHKQISLSLSLFLSMAWSHSQWWMQTKPKSPISWMISINRQIAFENYKYHAYKPSSIFEANKTSRMSKQANKNGRTSTSTFNTKNDNRDGNRGKVMISMSCWIARLCYRRIMPESTIYLLHSRVAKWRVHSA